MKKYRIRSGYILRQIAGEYAIIPINEESLITNAIMIPNESAAFIWAAFEQPCTIDDVVTKGMDKYDAPKEQIQKDVERFVSASLNLKIMEEVM